MKIANRINKKGSFLHRKGKSCIESVYQFNKNRKIDLSMLISPEQNDKRLREYYMKIEYIRRLI
jgi:hypothetical protein